MNKLVTLIDSLGTTAYYHGTQQKAMVARNALIALALPAGAPCTRLEFGWFRLKRTFYSYASGQYVCADDAPSAPRCKLRPVDLFTGKVLDTFRRPSETYLPPETACKAQEYWTTKKAEVFQYVFENTGYEIEELTTVEAFSNAMKNVSRTKWIYNALHALLELLLAVEADEKRYGAHVTTRYSAANVAG